MPQLFVLLFETILKAQLRHEYYLQRLTRFHTYSMQPEFVSLLGFLSIAIFISFLCSVLEAVLLSVTPAFIATQNGKKGMRLNKLKREVDRPLSAILTLNTFAHTIGAAGVGATAQTIWGDASLSIVSAIVTILILVFSEIVPKTIGAVYWKRLANWTAVMCVWLTWMLYPIVLLSRMITGFFKDGDKKSILSRVDVTNIVQFGYRDGLIRQHEKEIISNLMQTGHVLTSEIMIPRDKVVSLDEDSPTSSVNPQSDAWHVSRIPVYHEDFDQITGYILKDEILVAQISGDRSSKISTYKRNILKVASDTPLSELYQKLVSEDEHIAVVMDHDNVTGIVTMEDVIEEILGQEIVDESDRARGVLQGP